MYGKMKEHLSQTLAEIKEAGLYKEERLIESAQQAAITVKGKEVFKYAFSDDELEEVKKEIGKGFLIQRYKGLGEMNPEQLWDTTLNPETRTLYKVTIEDAAKAEKMVVCLGDLWRSHRIASSYFCDWSSEPWFSEMDFDWAI